MTRATLYRLLSEVEERAVRKLLEASSGGPHEESIESLLLTAERLSSLREQFARGIRDEALLADAGP